MHGPWDICYLHNIEMKLSPSHKVIECLTRVLAKSRSREIWVQGCPIVVALMMTSSNENIFRVTGHLCGEFIANLWIPLTKASDTELWCFLWINDNRWFPKPRPVTRIFDVFYDLTLNKRLSKQSWGCWFETQSCSLWRHCNGMQCFRGACQISERFYHTISRLASFVRSDCKTSVTAWWWEVLLHVHIWSLVMDVGELYARRERRSINYRG